MERSKYVKAGGTPPGYAGGVGGASPYKTPARNLGDFGHDARP